MSPRVGPPDPPDPARDLASAVTERRLRDLCDDPGKVFEAGGTFLEGRAVYVADVLAILDDPDPLAGQRGGIAVKFIDEEQETIIGGGDP